jgi:hypothetical protein
MNASAPPEITAQFMYANGETTDRYALVTPGFRFLRDDPLGASYYSLLNIFPAIKEKRERITCIQFGQGEDEYTAIFCAGSKFVASRTDVGNAILRQLSDADKFVASLSVGKLEEIHDRMQKHKFTHAIMGWPWGIALEKLSESNAPIMLAPIAFEQPGIPFKGPGIVAIHPTMGRTSYPAEIIAPVNWRNQMREMTKYLKL